MSRAGRPLVLIACLCAAIATPSAAGAVTITLGPTDLSASDPFVQCGLSCTTHTFIPTAAPGAALIAPADGTISSWRVKGGPPKRLRLQIVRAMGAGQFRGVHLRHRPAKRWPRLDPGRDRDQGRRAAGDQPGNRLPSGARREPAGRRDRSRRRLERFLPWPRQRRDRLAHRDRQRLAAPVQRQRGAVRAADPQHDLHPGPLHRRRGPRAHRSAPRRPHVGHLRRCPGRGPQS